jgi:hypothetical protein
MARKAKFHEYETGAVSAVQDALAVFEELRDELQNWRDNLPESLQNGSKADELDEAIGQLESAISYAEDEPPQVVEDLPQFTVSTSAKSKKSRADRRDEACSMLASAVDTARDFLDDIQKKPEGETDDAETKREAEAGDLDEWIGTIESAQNEAEQIAFPGMY